MWKNKQLKKRARKTLKSNYFTIVALCFVLSFFGIISSFGPNITSLSFTKEASKTQQVANDVTPSYTPGLIHYLTDFTDGSDKTAQVASKVLSSFKGTGGILYNLMYKIDQFVFTHNWAARAIVGLAIIVYLIYVVLIKNILTVGFSRCLIETRTYSKTKFGRVFFLFAKGGVLNASYTMIVRTMFIALLGLIAITPISAGVLIFLKISQNALWLLLGLAGSLIATYFLISQSFGLLMIPYILAENPLIQRKHAFKLSRNMMKGNKLHAFGLELSFIGWILLSLITGGLLSIFFLTGYRYNSRSELFLTLREAALDNNIEYCINLCDDNLMKPPTSLLRAEGIDVTEGMDLFPVSYPAMVPFKTTWFSRHVENMDPMRKYTLLTYVLFFFIFSFIGWCWEVSIHLVKDGVFINRGTMFGPWLPIYGTGGVMIIFLLKRFAKKPALLFACTMVLCSIVEYLTSWFLEVTKGMEWWNYSHYFFNLNGRICLEGALTFALGGCIFVYLAGPMLDNLLSKLPARPKIIACVVLVLLFSADSAYSHFHPNTGKGITDYSLEKQTMYGVKYKEICHFSQNCIASAPNKYK
ncbi:MAG: DUF975 family protein [Clostridiales bacterium]|nr:DUF975 family protein [Clostridiales bacterium]